MPDIKPIPGPSTPEAIDQAHMVVEAERELPDEQEYDARGGGMIYTCEFEGSEETRPQEMHGSVNYQKITSTEKSAPNFVAYTELTSPRKTVRG